MEQRRFCAKCNAPAVKGASFCVVCGGNDFILPQVEQTPVRAVALDDGVVGVPAESKFIKPDMVQETTADMAGEQIISDEAQPVYITPQECDYTAYATEEADSESVKEEPKPVRVASVMPDEGRTVAYKSFEEYERELAEQEALNAKSEKPKNTGSAKRMVKGMGFAFLCILLSVALLVGGFAIGVYFTHNGMLDEYLPERAPIVDEELQKDMEDCFEEQQRLAATIQAYINENKVYVDKTTTITIESEDGERCLVSVDGDCMTSADCAELLNNDYICPSDGAYIVEIIPYVDSEGRSMIKIEVSCDGGEEDYTHY